MDVLKLVLYKNYVIPKGTTLVSNIHTLHSSSDTFPEPDKFIPERFLNDSRSMYACGNGNVHNRDQFVFGWGRRICPGIYLVR
jgi:cytochrome P450